MNQYEPKEILSLLEHIKELNAVNKILNTFIPPFTTKSISQDYSTLHGSFRLGGTRSGRLSSKSPNLQNLPSTGTKYATPIKKCFEAPKKFIMVGADFTALEAKIAALVTKDPAKLKICIDGYEVHSFNTYAYWPKKMPDIVNTVESINSIKTKYPKLRQASKTITFAAQYHGTYKAFMQSGGFSKLEAMEIEANYKKLYNASIKWTTQRMQEASKTGYVKLAFGLKLKTPLLKQIIYGSSSSPYESHKEEKTASNATIQSYGLLNTRAANAFMKLVWFSKWKHHILPIAHIHDSQYYMIKNDIDCLKWTNDNLIKCMEWQELPEIQHPTVKLGANLMIYHPTWADAIELPNYLTEDEIMNTIREYKND